MRKVCLIFILLSSLLVPAWAGNPTSVPLNNPVYDFLERMETLGFVHNVFNGIKPFDRTEVANYLKEIATHRNQLTSIDRRKLDDFLLDFRWEIDRTKRYYLFPKEQNWYSILASWQNFKKISGVFSSKIFQKKKTMFFMGTRQRQFLF